MVDEKTRKSLFKDYRKCKWMEVNNRYEVTRIGDIIVAFVSIDEDGRVYVEWCFSPTSVLRSSEVNMVDYATGCECIQGIFTSKKEAVAIAKEWFKTEKSAVKVVLQ